MRVLTEHWNNMRYLLLEQLTSSRSVRLASIPNLWRTAIHRTYHTLCVLRIIKFYKKIVALVNPLVNIYLCKFINRENGIKPQNCIPAKLHYKLTYESIAAYDHVEAPLYVNWWHITWAALVLKAVLRQTLPQNLVEEVGEPTPYTTTRPELKDCEYTPFLFSISVPDCGVPKQFST